MLSVTDTTLDLFILEFIPHAAVPALFLLLLLSIFLPRHARSENDILTHARGIEARTRRMSFLEPEFRPRTTFGDAGVDGFTGDGGADTTGGLDTLAFVVEAVGNDGLGTVFVGGDLLWRETGGIIEFFVVGPVAAVSC